MRRLVLLIALPLAASEHFEKKVRPLFAEKCLGCHSGKTQMGGLNLATGAGADAARILAAVEYQGKVKMPPTGKLPDAGIAAVKAWIEEGGKWPGAAARTESAGDGRGHWAFQPLKAAASGASIDRFIQAKLKSKPARTDKLTLLRRVTYNLTGLPPTLEEITSFQADNSPQAFSKVVDRLLASPRYGERWGRHWLDVARLADSTGMDEDNLYPHAWRYRDFVVRSFNEDVPFDRFIHQQIAGDLLPYKNKEERARNLTATGFLALGPRPLAQQDRFQAVYDIVDEQIDTVSKVFLGMTLSCARCHDHKFDPLLTTDYYAMASIFASTTQFRNYGRPGSISYMHYEPLDADAWARYEQHRRRTYAKQFEMEEALAEDLGRDSAPLRQSIAARLEAAWKAIHKNEGQPDQWVKWLRANCDKAFLKPFNEATETNIAAVAAEYEKTYNSSASKWDQSLENWRSRFAKEVLEDRALPERPKPNAEAHPFFAAATFNGGPMEVAETPRVRLLRLEWEHLKKTQPEEPEMVSAVVDGPSVDQHVFVRGNIYNPGEAVPKRFPLVLAGARQKPIETGSGRLELARWLTSPDNPLTSRVLVNRVWQWHFGEALVRTPSNWGATGEKPSHPELLEYLAKRFMDSGWSMKELHRLILLSETYQMSARAPKEIRDSDPGNRLFSRFPRVRMSIEQIRDSLLALDGSLEHTMGGTLLVNSAGKRQKVDADEIRRRTLYLPVRRGSIPPLLSTFDFGDATTPGESRGRTNVAPQALFMLNSKFVIERSRGVARRLLDQSALSDAQRVEQAYLMTLTRPPTPAETDSALSYIAALEKRLATDGHLAAWQSFCHVLLSSNEFVYLN
ncbi:MAG: DUF1553 domain-containing protein [Bryobacteraceae bacterium]|nr:DUF1553 domain-containing protein [Bryobacteraceae bacterium]